MQNLNLRKPRPVEGRSGWALTFADMMTLLLCFFVLLFSLSDIDPDKYAQLAEDLTSTMGGVSASFVSGGDAPPPEDGEVRMSVARERQNLFELQLELAKVVGPGNADAVTLGLRPEAVGIDLSGAVCFESGKAVLTPRAERLLATIAAPLIRSGYMITVEGHTDDVPITSDTFPSNWELSGARASAVARFFLAMGLPGKRAKVVGYADTRPVVPNRTPSGEPIAANQARNRRVTILVQPEVLANPKLY